MDTTAVLLAAGEGSRIGLNQSKALINIDKPILLKCLDKFEYHKDINEIILVIKQEDYKIIKSLTKNYHKTKIYYGGKTRQESSYTGVKAATGDFILIHDIARPFISNNLISSSIAAAKKFGAAVTAIKPVDSLKSVSNGKFKTLDRNTIVAIQTPQTFKSEIIRNAHSYCLSNDIFVTDDSAMLESINQEFIIIEGETSNFKVTNKSDLPAKYGLGHDSHRLISGKEITLGGIKIPFTKTFDANSDGDIVLHSLFNAITSSIGKKSIGTYADEMYILGVRDSREYLKKALQMLEDSNHTITNIAITIEAKSPKLEPYIDQMRLSIAAIADIKSDNIGITCTSGEDLTSAGRGEGMQAFAIVSIVQL